jgi:hypothetical protein
MNTLLLGNLISLVGCLVMVAGGFLKEKKRILLVQCFQFGLQGTANLILGAVTGAVAGLVGILRNVVFSKVRVTWGLKLLFVGIQLVLSWASLQTGWLKWLPFVAAVMLTCFLDVKSEVWLKVLFIVTLLLWMVYDVCYWNYAALTFGVLTIVSNAIGIVMVLRDGKKE